VGQMNLVGRWRNPFDRQTIVGMDIFHGWDTGQELLRSYFIFYCWFALQLYLCLLHYLSLPPLLPLSDWSLSDALCNFVLLKSKSSSVQLVCVALFCDSPVEFVVTVYLV